MRFFIFATLTFARAFVPPSAAMSSVARAHDPECTAATVSSTTLYDPVARDAHYDGNIAQHVVDLHDSRATFNFCGGMLFQLVLSDQLRAHLSDVAQRGGDQPVVHDEAKARMAQVPGYVKSHAADNVLTFHGREVRQVPTAAGGMNFVLHLSLANGDDPEGWTQEELARYDGWGHDSSREWRKGDQLEREGFTSFRTKFGPEAFSLHHRFFWHLDQQNRLWLSAEDGCEGFASQHSGLAGPR